MRNVPAGVNEWMEWMKTMGVSMERGYDPIIPDTRKEEKYEPPADGLVPGMELPRN